MNKIEQKILEILKTNARISDGDLAQMVDISEEKVSQIISRLEKEGIILRYITIINEEKAQVNENEVCALIEVNVRPEKKLGFEAAAKRICNYSNVRDHYLISGTYDFLVIVEGKNLKEIAAFVSDKLAPIDNVRGTTTHFILKKYKEQGINFDGEQTLNRLAVCV